MSTLMQILIGGMCLVNGGIIYHEFQGAPDRPVRLFGYIVSSILFILALLIFITI